MFATRKKHWSVGNASQFLQSAAIFLFAFVLLVVCFRMIGCWWLGSCDSSQPLPPLQSYPKAVSLNARAQEAGDMANLGPPSSVTLTPPSNVSAAEQRLLAAVPQLLIIGVQKSGTSALYFGLCMHPNVSCAAYVKEPFYLSLPHSIQYLQRYDAWSDTTVRTEFHNKYVRNCFNLSQIKPFSITLEASTTYFESEAAFSLITKHLLNKKHIRAIVLLRDPISRAYSHYQHDLRHHAILPGNFDKKNVFHSKKFESFETAVQEELSIMKYCRRLDELREDTGLTEENEEIEYGSYYACIQRSRDVYLKKHKRALSGYLFKGLYYATLAKWAKAMPGRFLPVLYDDLRGDPLAVYEKVQRFLGLPLFDYTYALDSLQHEYQEGSKYEKFSGAIVRELAKEFSVHNQLLATLLDEPVPWDDSLAASNYVIPL